MENVFYFAFAGLIVIISLYVILKLLIKKFDPEKSRVRLYGVLGGMSNREIISISCFIICYILNYSCHDSPTYKCIVLKIK